MESEDEMKLQHAGAFLDEVDSAIQALSNGCQLPGWERRMRCRFCGMGIYEKIGDHAIAGNLQTAHERNYFA